MKIKDSKDASSKTEMMGNYCEYLMVLSMRHFWRFFLKEAKKALPLPKCSAVVAV
jgi:hypothetical protein